MARTVAHRFVPKGEERVVWLEEVSAQPYVRESVVWERDRQAPPVYAGHGRLVGYSVLRPRTRGVESPLAHADYFLRRLWWLAPWDPYTNGGQPSEAVNPASIRAGKPSASARRLGAASQP